MLEVSLWAYIFGKQQYKKTVEEKGVSIASTGNNLKIKKLKNNKCLNRNAILNKSTVR